MRQKSRAWLRHLHQQGYRLTQPLRAVVDVMAAADRALTPSEVHQLACRHYPPLGLTTVYRGLEKLAESGLIVRVHQRDSCSAYVAAESGHWHLLLCESCGRAAYFGGDQLDDLMRQVAENSGFEIREHWLQFVGLCAGCQSGYAADV